MRQDIVQVKTEASGVYNEVCAAPATRLHATWRHRNTRDFQQHSHTLLEIKLGVPCVLMLVERQGSNTGGVIYYLSF